MVCYVAQNALSPVEAAGPLSLVLAQRFIDDELFPRVGGRDWLVATAVEVLVNPLVVCDFAGVRQLAGHRNGIHFERWRADINCLKNK